MKKIVQSIGCILLGAPGSGKGTQAKIISNLLKIPHVSTGDALRSEIAKKSELGLKVAGILAAGELVSDELVDAIVASRLAQPDASSGYILDGYPRNIAQANQLARILSSLKHPAPIAVYIELPETELLRRILGRLSCSKCGSIFHQVFNAPKASMICDNCGATLVQRKDDTEETVKTRLAVYRQETAPLLSFYSQSGRLITVNGLQAISDITRDIGTALKVERPQ